MNLVGREGEAYRFRLGRAEKAALCALLKRYPLTPARHHRLTRSRKPNPAADQELLDESTAAHRRTSQRRVQRLLSRRDRFRVEGNQYEITFDREEIEWLLQVLNDVRVGTWVILGCPDPDQGKPPEPVPDLERNLVDMDLAAHFECRLLEALDGPLA